MMYGTKHHAAGIEGLDGAAAVKRAKGNNIADAEMCIKMLVSPNLAGKMIGRGGEQIKAIRNELGVGVHIHGVDNVFPKAADKQILVLFGPRESIDACFAVVIEKQIEARELGADGASLRCSLVCTQNSVSAMIGTKGATIKELRAQSGCNFSADMDNIYGEQMITVTGSPDLLPSALAMLTPFIEHSGDSTQFAEVHYGLGMQGAGGYDAYAAPQVSMKGAKGAHVAAAGKGKSKFGQPAIGAGIAGKGGNVGAAGGGMRRVVGMVSPHLQVRPQVAMHRAAVSPEEHMAMESQSTIQFTIPKDSISRVLGKSGASVTEIRRQTGVTQLTIQPQEEEGLVQIAGQLSAVHKAHIMVIGRVMASF